MVEEWVEHPPSKALWLCWHCVKGRSFPLVILKVSAIKRGLLTVCRAGRAPELIMELTLRSTGWINTWLLHPLSSGRAEGTWGRSWKPKGSSILLPKAVWGFIASFHNILHFYLGIWAFGNGVHQGFGLLPFSRLCDLGENFGHSNWLSLKELGNTPQYLYVFLYVYAVLMEFSAQLPIFECLNWKSSAKPSKPHPEHGAEVKPSKDISVPAPHPSCHLPLRL